MNTSSYPPHPPAELTLGTHLAPEDGACLMEWVSALAGEPWTDHPRTTHPLLAHLGRLVNDAMSPHGRQALIGLGPRLSGLDSKDPNVSAELAELCTGYALKVRPGLRLAWLHSAARRHQTPPWVRAHRTSPEGVVSRLRQRIYDHGPAHRAVETAVIVLARTPDPDCHLLRLLQEAVTHLEARNQGSVGPSPRVAVLAREAQRSSARTMSAAVSRAERPTPSSVADAGPFQSP